MLSAALVASAAIFHGTPATHAPFYVSLEQGQVFCGGSLIAPDRVLTAAHCVQGAGPRNFQARVGGRLRDVKSIYFPPGYRIIPSPVEPDDYSASATVNDIALVVLKRPVTDVPTLPIAATPPALGEPTLTVGRGMTEPNSDAPAAPRQSAQQTRDCRRLYPPTLLHTKVHLCTQDPTPTKSQACAGDSGSPVMVTREGRLQLSGVVTWGGETLGRDCGEGPADVSERVLAHAALVTGPVPDATAPYSTSAVRIDRHKQCHHGSWRPRSTTFKIRYFTRHGRRACRVTARTPGGWDEKESYNAVGG